MTHVHTDTKITHRLFRDFNCLKDSSWTTDKEPIDQMIFEVCVIHPVTLWPYFYFKSNSILREKKKQTKKETYNIYKQ